ncbi:MAG: glutamine--tRNA ligase/YqeY domain fusion protein [Gammaproteobacteria bacterium]|nr:glutamine--tRNA ligase/YqeY domain fusion protein [Gammaproteobacteria bacterium]
MNDTLSPSSHKNFIYNIIDEDLKIGKNGGKVATRFPPEPNGYLHIGHAKSICLNFGIAHDYNGTCNLRFDDTNPEKEEQEYIDSIIENVKWLGFDWEERLYHASDYFEKFFQFAVSLIKQEKAYVCDLTADQIREYRGNFTTPGKESPYRNRSVEENLDLFNRMRGGEFKDGEKILRAKIDMSSPNINMRDPAIYRIRHEEHPRTGDKWCIYPMYDYAHCVSDALENITHSVCTLEFEDHRPLYDWFLDQIEELPHPQQIEFARLNLTYTVMSKRKLLELVETKLVNGWDDPRMPTLVGIRRRGFTPAAIRNFCEKIGVTKQESTVEMGYLEECVREDLNLITKRVMAVLKPLRVVITNFPKDKIDELDAPYHPNDPQMGSRKIFFTNELYIEQDDFMEEAPKKFFRLAPGQEVRLRYGYVIRCEQVIKNLAGEITELHCTYDPETRGGNIPDGRKVKGTIHWVSVKHAVKAEVRLYDRLFNVENPLGNKDIDFKDYLNSESLKVLEDCLVEPSIMEAKPEEKFQFERLGYFCVDYDSTSQKLIFNRTVTLKDGWAKISLKRG